MVNTARHTLEPRLHRAPHTLEHREPHTSAQPLHTEPHRTAHKGRRPLHWGPHNSAHTARRSSEHRPPGPRTTERHTNRHTPTTPPSSKTSTPGHTHSTGDAWSNSSHRDGRGTDGTHVGSRTGRRPPAGCQGHHWFGRARRRTFTRRPTLSPGPLRDVSFQDSSRTSSGPLRVRKTAAPLRSAASEPVRQFAPVSLDGTRRARLPRSGEVGPAEKSVPLHADFAVVIRSKWIQYGGFSDLRPCGGR